MAREASSTKSGPPDTNGSATRSRLVSVPGYRDEFLEERRVLPSWVYRQEYECSFEETEDQVFTTEMVEQAVTPEVTPLFESG
jgi:hypothetical protein